MTSTAIREKLHHDIDTANDKQLKAIYSVVDRELSEGQVNSKGYDLKLKIMLQAATDPLFLADLEEIQNDFAHLDNNDI